MKGLLQHILQQPFCAGRIPTYRRIFGAGKMKLGHFRTVSTLKNDENGDEYYCLYWEGKSGAIMDKSKGFCVAGKDTAKFLREKLMYIGLTAREANEFIIYWLPKMQDNPYNIITLHTADYARIVPLTVSPAPDTQIRVFMTYKSSDASVDIQEQTLPHYERNGFTLVEWGGSEE